MEDKKMCIQKNQLETKVKELRQYKRIKEEAAKEIERLETELQEYMTQEEIDTLTGDDFKITWKTYFKNSFDTKTLKIAAPEIYNKYLKETSYKKFLVS